MASWALIQYIFVIFTISLAINVFIKLLAVIMAYLLVGNNIPTMKAHKQFN